MTFVANFHTLSRVILIRPRVTQLKLQISILVFDITLFNLMMITGLCLGPQFTLKQRNLRWTTFRNWLRLLGILLYRLIFWNWQRIVHFHIGTVPETSLAAIKVHILVRWCPPGVVGEDNGIRPLLL